MRVLILIFLVVAVQLILSLTFKNSSKVDHGPALNYYRLSYRRKMIRTLWNMPIILILLPVLYFTTNWSLAALFGIGFFAMLAFFIQFFYTYRKWKSEGMRE